MILVGGVVLLHNKLAHNKYRVSSIGTKYANLHGLFFEEKPFNCASISIPEGFLVGHLSRHSGLRVLPKSILVSLK